jgi:hypothetical protein
MELPPLVQETELVQVDDPESLPGVGGAHMVVLPEGRRGGFVPKPDEYLSSSDRLDVNVRRLMFSGRGVDEDPEATLIEDLHHGRSINPTLD